MANFWKERNKDLPTSGNECTIDEVVIYLIGH